MKKIIALVCVALVAGTAAATAPALPKGFLLYEKAAARGQRPRDQLEGQQLAENLAGGEPVWQGRRRRNRQGGRADGDVHRGTGLHEGRAGDPVRLEDGREEGRHPGSRGPVGVQVQTASGSSYRYVSAPVAGLGDEALKVSGQFYHGKKAGVGGERSVLVRKANAVLVYLLAGEYSKRPSRTGPTSCVTPGK